MIYLDTSDRGMLRSWADRNCNLQQQYVDGSPTRTKSSGGIIFQTQEGVQNFTDPEARAMCVEDLDQPPA